MSIASTLAVLSNSYHIKCDVIKGINIELCRSQLFQFQGQELRNIIDSQTQIPQLPPLDIDWCIYSRD